MQRNETQVRNEFYRDRRKKKSLSLARSARTAKRIYIPKLDVFGKIFHADFALHFRSRFAEPHHAELRFRALILKVNHIARFELRINALQRRSVAADRAQTCRLCKWTRMCVHAPDFYGKFDSNALLAAAVHADFMVTGRSPAT